MKFKVKRDHELELGPWLPKAVCKQEFFGAGQAQGESQGSSGGAPTLLGGGGTLGDRDGFWSGSALPGLALPVCPSYTLTPCFKDNYTTNLFLETTCAKRKKSARRVLLEVRERRLWERRWLQPTRTAFCPSWCLLVLGVPRGPVCQSDD